MSKRKLITKITMQFDTNSTKLLKKIQVITAEEQDNGSEIEIQYSTSRNKNNDIEYSALILTWSWVD